MAKEKTMHQIEGQMFFKDVCSILKYQFLFQAPLQYTLSVLYTSFSVFWEDVKFSKAFCHTEQYTAALSHI